LYDNRTISRIRKKHREKRLLRSHPHYDLQNAIENAIFRTMMKRLLLFALDGRADGHVPYLLNALKPFREESLVIAGGLLSSWEETVLAGVSDRVIRCLTGGDAFALWCEALREFEAPAKDFDALLLVSSRCIGPFFPLQEMFEKMEKGSFDFWGVADGASGPECFMEIRRSALESPAFRNFFRERVFRSRQSGREFISCMTAAGFRYGSFVEVKDPRTAPNAGICEPLCRNIAPFLIRNCRMPLLDAAAFAPSDRTTTARGYGVFRALRESGSTYPAELITDSLRRNAPLSHQKDLPETILTADRNGERESVPGLKLGVIFHCHFPDRAGEILPYLANIPVDFDLRVTSSTPEAEKTVRDLAGKLPHVRQILFRETPNRGRDVAPWLCAFPAEEHLSYDLLLKIHLKGSSRMPEAFTAEWMDYTLDSLAGSPALVSAILRAFAEEPALGMVFPPYPPIVTLQCPAAYAGHPADREAGRKILAKMGLNPPPETGMPVFGTGTMFFYRPAALKTLLKAPWTPEDFPPEPLPWRGTAAHAMERIVPYIAQSEGYFFRQSIHTDRLAEAFRTYEDRLLYDVPGVKACLKLLLRSLGRRNKNCRG